MLHRRTLAALLATPLVARAQGFPARPLRLICTYPPAGVTDIVSRIVAEPLGRVLGQNVVVENRAGAGGQIGALAASQAEPDGLTLMLGTAAMFGVNPVLYASQGLVPQRDFAHLGMIGVTPNVLSVNAHKSSISSVAELVAAGRRGTLTMGSVGNGSSSHLSGVLFGQRMGLDLTHVPYRGTAPSMAAVMNGEVLFAIDNAPASRQQVLAGMLKALGSRSRHIFLQFLAEALAISVIGGVIGIILAVIVSVSVGRLTLYSAMAKHAEAGDIRLLIDPSTLLVASLILIAVGVISGMVPAMKASKLDPVEALQEQGVLLH